jgi:RNA polymerase sigma factor (sigma-70 family)
MFTRDPLAKPEPLIRRVYAYAAYRLGDGPDAEDVVGETFERAVRYRDRYDPKQGPPIAWLLGIAHRCVSEAYAGRSDEPRAELTDTAREIEEDAVRRLELSAAVNRLDERDRELIALRYGADLTAAQIAEHLGLRTNTVEVRLHRALARLRSMLENREQPDVRVLPPNPVLRVETRERRPGRAVEETLDTTARFGGHRDRASRPST